MNNFLKGPQNVIDFIKFHNANYINYCEVIIYPDGKIEYCIPSHQETLIRATGKTRDEIWNNINIYDDVLITLCNMTNCIAVWYDLYVVPNNITIKQWNSLILLKNNKCINSTLYLNKKPGYHK